MQVSPIELRTLTELDHVRLYNLLRRFPVDNADLVSPQEVPADTVTMYSQVVIADGASGTRSKLTLCYPHDAEPAGGFISILSPIGTSLIGLRVGQVARWQGPDGHAATAQLLAILFQPEASGDYLM